MRVKHESEKKVKIQMWQTFWFYLLLGFAVLGFAVAFYAVGFSQQGALATTGVMGVFLVLTRILRNVEITFDKANNEFLYVKKRLFAPAEQQVYALDQLQRIHCQPGHYYGLKVGFGFPNDTVYLDYFLPNRGIGYQHSRALMRDLAAFLRVDFHA